VYGHDCPSYCEALTLFGQCDVAGAGLCLSFSRRLQAAIQERIHNKSSGKSSRIDLHPGMPSLSTRSNLKNNQRLPGTPSNSLNREPLVSNIDDYSPEDEIWDVSPSLGG